MRNIRYAEIFKGIGSRKTAVLYTEATFYVLKTTNELKFRNTNPTFTSYQVNNTDRDPSRVTSLTFPEGHAPVLGIYFLNLLSRESDQC